MKKKLKKRVVNKPTEEQIKIALRVLKVSYYRGTYQQSKSDLSKEFNCKFDWRALESLIDFEYIDNARRENKGFSY